MRQWLLSITKAFVLLVLATSFLEIWPTDQQFEVIELYAGAARITRLARAIGLSACAHDVTFDDNANSSFNLLGNAGFLPLRMDWEQLYFGFTLLFGSTMVALSKLNGRCCDTTLGIYLGLQYIAFYIRSMTTSPWPWVFSAQHLFK